MKRVCGLDVHKETIFCATIKGEKRGLVTEHSTLTPSIRAMGEQLRNDGIEEIAMESTGIYWVPVWNILEEMGFQLILVNPYLIYRAKVCIMSFNKLFREKHLLRLW